MFNTFAIMKQWLFLACFGLSSCYLPRVLKYNVPDLDDYKIFSRSILPAHPDSFQFINKHDSMLGKQIHVMPLKTTLKGEKYGKCQTLDDYIKNSNAIAFTIIRNDTILFEKYSKGYTNQNKYASFSTIKSLAIMPLIGIAIDEGFIKSVDDPITNYFPELKQKRKFEKVTIRHILNMNSGIAEFPSPEFPLSPQLRYYYGSHLEDEPKRLRIESKPEQIYRYSPASSSQLLGFLIERTTGKKLDDYFNQKIWSKIGPEHDAYWAKDREGGNIKAFCCFYANNMDYARLAKLYLNNGNWNGEQIVPSKWMEEIFSSVDKKSYRYWLLSGQKGHDYYSMHWYVGTKDYKVFKASGFHGQLIYLFPEQNTLFVLFTRRKGFKRNPYQVELFYQIMDELSTY